MEDEIKRGWNIYLYYLTIPVFILLFFINYFSKNFSVEALDVGLIISVVSFLFGFLITITFSMLLSKVASLKEALANETGRLISLYSLSKHLGKNFYESVRKKIDFYTITTLRNYTNYEKGRDAVYGLYDDISAMEIKTETSQKAASSFIYLLGEFEPLREKLEYLTSRRVEWPLKLANYLLGTILIVLLFLNRSDSFTNTIFVILSTIIVFIFLIIEDYDNLRIGDYAYNISNSEQIFDLIGRERYYPENVLNRVELKRGTSYRVGFLDKKSGKEKIILMTYSPGFSSRVSKMISFFKKRNKKL